MKTNTLPTQAQIKELLHYDPKTGIFRWRYSIARRVRPWDIAGTKTNLGYVRIKIGQEKYMAHRLAWVCVTGEQPVHEVDHIDGVGVNNAWENLREATTKQNKENLPLSKKNTSGFRGVSWSKKHKKWRAVAGHNKKFIHIGFFDTAEEAGQAAAAKRAELFTHDTGRDALNETKGK